VLGNLWEVTDRDIDMFGLDIFQNWINGDDEQRSVSLACLVQKARSACKMRWLNGSAPVVYGLPITLRR
jgi:separase